MNTSYVLDANALLDLMVDGAGAQSVERLIKSARLVACRRVTITSLLASKLAWLMTAKSGLLRHNVPT